MTATIGSDPELFITDKLGKFKSIIGLIGGTKEEPRIIGNGFAVQEDNVAAEYNIPASASRDAFIANIRYPQMYIAELLGDGYVISRLASASFPAEELLNPKAMEFGCDPDYNAWTMQMNKKPVCDDATFRTAGGHIHIGMEDKDPHEIIRIIRAMDKLVGVWTVLMDPDDQRRKLYGKAGAFRPQPHGCEYRSASNFWIFDEALIGEVWDRTQSAVGHEIITDEDPQAAMIQHIINTGDKVLAKTFLQVNHIT